jgi:hypothetical protein
MSVSGSIPFLLTKTTLYEQVRLSGRADISVKRCEKLQRFFCIINIITYFLITRYWLYGWCKTAND